MEYSINTRPLLQESDSEEENVDLRTQSYQENVVVRDNKPLFKQPEPNDKFNLAYIIFYLLGMTTLMPWNFFITADDYWMYKFRDVNNNFTNLMKNDGKRTPMQAEFPSYLSVASSTPNIAFLLLTTILSQRISLQFRILGSLSCMLILFIITTVFVKVNTDEWQQTFFLLTLCSVVLLNAFSAILSGSIFGIIGKFSPKYITATVGGQALGGIFAAIAQIVSLAIGISSQFSAFVYFMIGNLMILVSLVSYVVLSRTVFFKYHISEKTGITVNEFQTELSRPRIVNYSTILRKIWTYGVSVFLVFTITLSIYPGVSVLIESEDKSSGSAWTNTYFVPVVSYLLFSTGDYTGRLLAGYFQKPKKGKWIIVINLMRIVFIPLLLFCNAQPRHSNLPVLLNKDYYYITVITLFSISNGYLANLSVICAPRIVDQHEKETASSMMTVFMGVGLGLGSAIGLLIVKLI
ncbi:PREDICTED: equilibrative nucleoside transporter 3 [Nicrophorus vespilloides]|uniref:Equilibrative nucleoside transporter 3 n=1 Tax=Nicrophorus vespilloides TaxID=110193 RepID=A0ABM1MC60_NICVS|nr:PREDICTED: equilibrative nucleoside transporter 3 [Nicrophorus vespilloides]